MAIESVATRSEAPATATGDTHDLWLNTDVLGIKIVQEGWTPEPGHCRKINKTIQGLARAAKSVVYQAENDTGIDTIFCMQPIEDIADAIILLSQLSAAVTEELTKSKGAKA